MKQKKIVSLIGALILIISAVMLITGCSQPNSNKENTGNNSENTDNNGGNSGSPGNADIVKKYIIEFDTASIKCQKKMSLYTDITTGSPIQEKDKLYFEAILPTGKVVENWYINDVKQEYETDLKMYYTVKASDIVGGKLKIKVVFKDAVQGTVEFDTASVKCKNTNSYPYTEVTTGSPIQENDKLYFEAILPSGKIVENWYINDAKQEYKTDVEIFYTVKASDIVGGKLKISVVFK
jgi:lipoprotein